MSAPACKLQARAKTAPDLSSFILIMDKQKTRKTNKGQKMNVGSLMGAISSSTMTKRVSGEVDPPPVLNRVRTTSRFRSSTLLPPTGAVNGSVLLNFVPDNGVSPITRGSFKSIRLMKVSVWTPNGDDVTLSFRDDPTILRDRGTPGARAGCIHGRPPLSVYQDWVTDLDLIPLFTIGLATPTTPYVVDVSVEIVTS